MSHRPACPLLLALWFAALAGPALATEGSAPPSRKPPSSPCREDARYRAFDYWLGRWEVRRFGAGPEAPLHHNEVTLEQDGCVLQEHWRDARGGTGTSFTIFDASRGVWHQTWVDATGRLSIFEGQLNEKGELVLESLPLPAEASSNRRVRMSYLRLAGGEVRQLIEQSGDGGKTWGTMVDFHYRRTAA